MKINFVSLFSGIEAASVAMSRIPDAEWTPVFFSEIDPYANALLAHRFPHVPNLGDICKIRADIQKGTITNGRTTLPFPDGGIHLLCGGSPCQDVSTAGLRRGMEENSATRSSLAFEYLRLVDELRPRCILWENVAGVLSSRRGLDFRDFLRRLVELGFGVAWRVLDCQYTRSDSFPRAIPQRRRRVFLLGLRTGGHSGTDAVRAAEILLERNGVLGNPETEREEGQALAAPAGYGPLRANRDFAEGFGESGPGYWLRGGQSQTLRARDRPTFPAQVAVYPYAQFGGYNADGGASSTVNATDSKHLTDLVVTNGGGCVGFDANQQLLDGGFVRRLTPTECETLQEFPRGWTDVPVLGKPASDAARFKGLGNSWATNCAEWILRRLVASDVFKE